MLHQSSFLYISFCFALFSSFHACTPKQESTSVNIETTTASTADVQAIRFSAEQLSRINPSFCSLEQATIPATIKLSGKVDVPPQSLVFVSVSMGGYLKSTPLLTGMVVRKGSTIAVLEDMQYVQLQQDYLSAKTQLEITEKEYMRQKQLYENNIASTKDFEQISAQYKMQQIGVRSLEQKLKLIGINPAKLTEETISNRIEIKAPVSGIVAAVRANVGKYINPSDVLFEIIDTEDIHLTLTVFDKDFHKLKVGQKVWAYTNSNPEKKYKAEIILLGKNLGADNSMPVHCHFLEYDDFLMPGMFMNAEIELDNQQSWTLPEAALVRSDGTQFVFVAMDSTRFQLVPVQTGNVKEGRVEILNFEELKSKKVVEKGAYTMLMALKNKSDE